MKLGNGIVGNRPTTTRCLLGILPCPQLFWLSLQAVWPLTPCYLELIVPNLDNNDSLLDTLKPQTPGEWLPKPARSPP